MLDSVGNAYLQLSGTKVDNAFEAAAVVEDFGFPMME
jgi:hypothetical protein